MVAEGDTGSWKDLEGGKGVHCGGCLVDRGTQRSGGPPGAGAGSAEVPGSTGVAWAWARGLQPLARLPLKRQSGHLLWGSREGRGPGSAAGIRLTPAAVFSVPSPMFPSVMS